MTLLQDLNRDYRRFRPSPSEKIQLANNGLQWVLSSNVSGIGINGKDLIIRFHNGSMYLYPNQAHLYDDMMKSNSKGRFVWQRLRRTRVAYRKIGTLPFKDDVDVADEDMFTLIDMQGLEMVARLQALGMFVPNAPTVLELFTPFTA